MQGAGYYVASGQFHGVEAKAEWPANPGDRAEFQYIGLGASVSVRRFPLTASFEQFKIGHLQWTSTMALGGFNIHVFAGGAFGSLTQEALNREKSVIIS